MNLRKIFNYDNMGESKIVDFADANSMYTNTISACGCLFYKELKNTKQLLLIKYEDPNWPKLDDFGGRIDDTDDSVFAGIIRETVEETNGVINEEYLSKIILDGKYKSFYNRQSKYFMILVKVDDNFCLDTKLFGELEITDNIKRTIDWHDYDSVKDTLAYRLSKNSEFMKYIEQ